MRPLVKSESYVPMSRSKFRRLFIQAGATKAEADAHYRATKHKETWVNELYVVTIDRDCNHALGESARGGMFEISVRRVDREPIFDWRHLQQIKNQLVGEESEMVQLFPAESRLRDAANQYWFYGFNDSEIRFPFGMFGRHVDESGEHAFGKSKQRPISSDQTESSG